MISPFLLLATVAALLGQPSPVAGSIGGVVVNASRDMTPVGGAEIVLSVQVDGQLVIAAEGVADDQGRFLFDNIPADTSYVYLPGANRNGVHYPGPRVKLTAGKPHARVRLTVRDTVSEPNPLVLRRHEITLHVESDALRVTETLLIDNPGTETYVGQPVKQDGRAATLRLSIPSDFRRATFHQEFFGRQFTLIDGRLVTDIPWTPGQRTLAFTYVLPNDDHRRIWQRPLDLPCDQLRIEVHTDAAEAIDANLPRAAAPTGGAVVFESTGRLPAGHVVRLQPGRLPISIATYSRWLALAVLVILIAATTLTGMWRRRPGKSQSADDTPAIIRKNAA